MFYMSGPAQSYLVRSLSLRPTKYPIDAMAKIGGSANNAEKASSPITLGG